MNLTGRRTKFLTLAFWLGLAVVVAPPAAKLAEVQSNETISYLPRSAEATKAYERAADAFGDSDRLVAVAVYARDSGLTTADRAKAAADRTAFARWAPAGAVPDVQDSPDGKAMLISFPLAGDSSAQEDAAGEVKDRVAAGVPDGLRTGLTGTAGGTEDLLDAFSGLDGTLILVTAGVVVLLLLVIYRSPILW